MKLKRLYDDQLAQAAYLVIDRGEAVVIDPNRDVGAVVEAASREGARIVAVTETHIHADFVSGARELARRTGASLHLSDEGGADWRYVYANAAQARPLKDGDTIMVGAARLEARHTPGHTPEHLTFLLSDTGSSERPVGAFTGDFLFVGDVGRPDLLESAARVRGAAESGARALYRSIRRFLELPDWLQLWPGHGAGSACGKGIGGMPQSTIGYEKIANRLLSIENEDTFIRAVLEGLTEPPPYFAHMKRINREGPEPFAGRPRPERVAGARIPEALAGGAIVVDTRAAAEFAQGHIPGTLNIPLDRSFLTWAGWLVPIERELFLIIDARSGGGIDEALRDLAKIGIERIAGWTGTNALEQWDGGRLQQTPRIAADDIPALESRGGAAILDVRTRAEWDAGHIAGAVNIPLGELPRRLAEVPGGRPLVVHCQGGARAAIAASLLQAAGIEDVRTVSDGFAAWERGGRAVERPGAGVSQPA